MDVKAAKLDRVRGRIAKWLYLAPRQSFLRGEFMIPNSRITFENILELIISSSDTKKCGYYTSEVGPLTGPHGGPSNGATNEAGPIENEQTSHYSASTYVESLEINNPRPNRRRREDALDSGPCLIPYDICCCLHSQ